MFVLCLADVNARPGSTVVQAVVSVLPVTVVFSCTDEVVDDGQAASDPYVLGVSSLEGADESFL